MHTPNLGCLMFLRGEKNSNTQALTGVLKAQGFVVLVGGVVRLPREVGVLRIVSKGTV